MRTSLAASALLWLLAAAASASPVTVPAMPRTFPLLPHGQDWNIFVVPQPEPVLARLSEGEAEHVRPQVPRLRYADAPLSLSTPKGPSNVPPLYTVLGVIIGTVLLLAAYDLIPRAHAGFLRLRSLHLKQDLFT